jgi:hypothetical protein
MQDKNDAAILKRDAIRKANKVMFGAVAGASAVLGIAIVGCIFLYQNIMFQGKVIGEQSKSLQNMDQNIKNIDVLKKKLVALQTNDDLRNTPKINDEDNNLRAILDALPADENVAALGASLTQKIFDVPGVSVESITPNPVAIDVNLSDKNTSETNTSATKPAQPTDGKDSKNKTGFKAIEVVASLTAKDVASSESGLSKLVEVLKKMERSIRSFRITNFKFEKSKGTYTLNLTLQAFYMPEYQMALDSKTVKADENAKSSGANTSTKNTTKGNVK